jgi:hypothetical protein
MVAKFHYCMQFAVIAHFTAFSGIVPFIYNGDVPLDRDVPKLCLEYCHILPDYTASCTR